ncbi:hypothetical protein GCM10027180_27320 [Microbulbifer echini]
MLLNIVSVRSKVVAPRAGALYFNVGNYYYYDEETVNTYEISGRSTLANGNINLSGNIFYNDDPGYRALSSSKVIINREKIETYGAELEAIAMPHTQLEIRAGLGLLESEIIDAGESYSDTDGNELNSAPGLTANLGVRYWHQ